LQDLLCRELLTALAAAARPEKALTSLWFLAKAAFFFFLGAELVEACVGRGLPDQGLVRR
jgi:hypothetical protein